MNAKFKTLGLAAAVAAGSFGMVSATQAQTVSNTETGDMAIIPYYSTQGDWITGFHITNTADEAVAVKVRLRRDTDSADVLDINVVMSPHDVWTAYITDTADGKITLNTQDNTCTVPVRTGTTRTWVSPNPATYTGATEGYVEVISMGAQATVRATPGDINTANNTPATDLAYWASIHNSSGVPADCVAVQSNFLAANANGSANTTQAASATATTPATLTAGGVNTWVDASNALKVSYFLRDAATGIEFGNSAVHIDDFLANPSITNQEYGLDSLGTGNDAHARAGFEFPNLNGAPGEVGKFNTLRTATVLGVTSVMNDWSYATARGVNTDWVVTMPGQYLMEDLFYKNDSNDATPYDYRDIPVGADFTLFNREEQTRAQAAGEVVVSPTPADVVVGVSLKNEVNVIEWGPASVGSVLGSDAGNVHRVDPAASGVTGESGWAMLGVTSTTAHAQIVCDYTLANTYAAYVAGTHGCTDPAAGTANAPRGVAAAGNVPMVGFVAWKRTFDNADRNYGRIVEHSYTR